MGQLAEQDLAAILSRIREDRASWELVEVSPLVLGRAEELIHGMSLARQRNAAGQGAMKVVWIG